jgi:hypothetical protein
VDVPETCYAMSGEVAIAYQVAELKGVPGEWRLYAVVS